jgi:hypothetical protein
MLRGVSILAAIVIAGEAAAEMPRYNVAAHCKAVAEFGGNYSEMMYDGCFQMEQTAYNNLKPRWDGLAATLRSHCDRIATFGGAGSYSMLEGCVQMEEQAGSTDNVFEY